MSKSHYNSTLLYILVFSIALMVPAFAVAQDYSFEKGFRSYDFQILNNGTGPTPGGFEFAWSKYLGEKTAVRFGTSLTGSYNSSDRDYSLEEYDSLEVAEEVSSFNGTFSVSPQLVFFPLSGERIQLSTGFGPILSYSWAYGKLERKSHQYDILQNDYSYTQNEDYNNRSLSAGVLWTVGAHYFISPKFALSAFYGTRFMIVVDNLQSHLSRDREDASEYDIDEVDEASEIGGRFDSTMVGVGLTFYY